MTLDSVQFLQRLRPHGPWNLTALDPADVAAPEATTFTDPVRAGHWIAARNGKRNLYYNPNPVGAPTGWRGRVTKTDVLLVVGRWVDLDLDKLEDSLSLAERKAAAVVVLRAFKDPGPPSVIIDSGGGLQALWMLDVPEPVTPDLLSVRANEHLCNVLGGDPNALVVSQLLRLPGTTNLPNDTKLKRGRVKAEAVLIEFNDTRYADWEFQLAAPRPKLEAVDVEIGEAEPVEDLDALFAQYHVPERLQRIVREGPLPDFPKERDNSFSVWVLDAACGLVRCGVPPAQIVAVLLDEELGIGRDAGRQAYRAVKKALSLVAREQLPDEEYQQRLDNAPVVDDAEKQNAPIDEKYQQRLDDAPIDEEFQRRLDAAPIEEI